MKVEHCYPNSYDNGGRLELVNISYKEATLLKNILLADREWERWRELIRTLDLIAAANEPSAEQP